MNINYDNIFFGKSSYNPDGHCRACCIEKIFKLLNVPLRCGDLTKIKNTKQTIDLFAVSGIKYYLHIPLISIASPRVLVMYIKNFRNATLKASKFYNKISTPDTKVLLYHLTAFQLYGIKEEWSHCVLELHADSKIYYYDPLLSQLVKERKLNYQYKNPTNAQLLRYLGIKVLAWR